MLSFLIFEIFEDNTVVETNEIPTSELNSESEGEIEIEVDSSNYKNGDQKAKFD